MYNSLTRDIEHFGDIYDRRINEYDNCEGVGEVIKKIRKGTDEGTKNYGNWQSNDKVKQVPCVPIYKWDGKFYKDEESAKAGSDAEEIMRPAQGGTASDGKATHVSDEKEPGDHTHKTGKFLMSSVYSTGAWSTPSLDGTYGWLARSDRKTSPGWMRMETVSGDIEMIKGVVTAGRDKNHHTDKFKVFVSRNGDSWKQMKDMNNNEEFTAGVAEKTNYFNEPVQAKYIKFVVTAGASWRSLKAGYVKDKSGTVNCTGGSGMFNGTPWFRFTFDEAKTKSMSTYSEGTADSNKLCPTNGNVMVRQKGNITIGDNNIPVGNLKIIQGGIVKGLKGVMGNKTLRGCGSDPSSVGWRSSASGASFSWSACVKPDSNGLRSSLPTEADAFSTSDGGYRYMFRHWSGSNNNSIYDTGDGYNKLSDSTTSYKDNTQNSNANNGSTYTKIATKFKVQNYNDVNIIRQPCNRGTKGVLPTLGTGWISNVCSCKGGESDGYSGHIYNISGGTEGWIDQVKKYTWANFFHNKLQNLVTAKLTSGSFLTAVNNFKVVKKEGTNGNVKGTDSHTWSDGSKKHGGHIDGNKAYHSTGYDATAINWSQSLDNPKSVAKYKQDTNFTPIGIEIQPRSGYKDTQAPTEIKLVWGAETGSNKKEQIVTLDDFSSNSTVKTILIDPNKRSSTKIFNVYSRHGKNSASVSFRINYLIGESGGKSIDKGTSNCSNGNISPVDCKLGSGHTEVNTAAALNESNCKLFPTNIGGHSEDEGGVTCNVNHNSSQSTSYGNTAYDTQSELTSSGTRKYTETSKANSRGSCHNPPWSYTNTLDCPWKGNIRIHRDCSNRDSLSKNHYTGVNAFDSCLAKCKGKSGLKYVSYYEWSGDCFCLKKSGCSLQKRGSSGKKTAILWSK